METENAPPTLPDLARRQWGVVTRDQLVDAGMATRGISDWVRAGRLRRLHRGVYAFGHDRLRTEGYWTAAVLACGQGAVLSHRSAAALWNLRQAGAALIDVTVPSRNGRVRRAGVRVHRSGRLSAEEVTRRDGIPVTTVARTLLDLTDVLDRQALRRAITEAEYLNLFDLTSLDAVVDRNPGRGSAKLRSAADTANDRTRSPLEDRFLGLLERHGVERPLTNCWIAGYEADFAWPRAGLVVELDGVAAHSTTAAIKRDRRKDRALWRAGFRSLRLTAEDLDDVDAVLDDLGHAGVDVASRPRCSSKHGIGGFRGAVEHLGGRR
jgi:very-short-patch-repair endonuclease